MYKHSTCFWISHCGFFQISQESLIEKVSIIECPTNTKLPFNELWDLWENPCRLKYLPAHLGNVSFSFIQYSNGECATLPRFSHSLSLTVFQAWTICLDNPILSQVNPSIYRDFQRISQSLQRKYHVCGWFSSIICRVHHPQVTYIKGVPKNF